MILSTFSRISSNTPTPHFIAVGLITYGGVMLTCFVLVFFLILLYGNLCIWCYFFLVYLLITYVLSVEVFVVFMRGLDIVVLNV